MPADNDSSDRTKDTGPVSQMANRVNNDSILGVKLYVLLLICALLVFLLVVGVLVLAKRNRWWRIWDIGKNRNKSKNKKSCGIIPLVSKEIKALDEENDDEFDCESGNGKKMGDILNVRNTKIEELKKGVSGEESCFDGSSSGGSKLSAAPASSTVSVDIQVVQNIGWGRWYSFKELQDATNGFDRDSVIGEGGYGIVYRGVLDDGSVVAVKNLLNNKGQAEKEFKVEVEAIGKVRHKNLVGLLGYCIEGAQRLLVYEFVDNGNLEEWLHGDMGPISALTWDIRMKIALGTAKGLAYLHEGLEPKVVHRDVKSSNILLDKSWNAKVSDFGLAKLLRSEASYVTTRVMGTFGYVSPEYASTGMLNEGSDVYSFGVLLMELITGRSPVDYTRPPGEMNLVDWFKGLVASRRGEEVVDPRTEVRPSPRALKRMLLVCLRCIDLDVFKRPKMGQIVHMLEADEFPFRADHRPARDAAPLPPASTSSNFLYSPRDIAVDRVQSPR